MKQRLSAVAEIFRGEVGGGSGAFASRKIVHFRHTLVKLLKPFFSRSFGAVNLKSSCARACLFSRAKLPLHGCKVFCVRVKAASRKGLHEVGDSLGRARWLMHQRYGEARSGDVLIIGARL
ncbi:hypothetical protein D3C85_587160 [compost metagenome]